MNNANVIFWHDSSRFYDPQKHAISFFLYLESRIVKTKTDFLTSFYKKDHILDVLGMRKHVNRLDSGHLVT